MLADPGAPATNRVQYFENMGSRAIVADGWKAVCKHEPGADYDTEPWELYHLVHDRSECNDLARLEPDRLAALIERWWEEAERHGVLPLDDRGVELFGARFRDRSPHPSNRRYVYRPPMSPMPGQAGAAIAGRSFDLTARITSGPGDAGVLFATGNRNAGMSVFVEEGRLVLDYNAFGDHTVVVSDREVAVGDAELAVRLRRGDGMQGTAELLVDGETAGRAELSLFMRMMSSTGPSIGFDHGSAVSPRYRAPNPYTGELHEIVVQASPERFADAAASEARAEMHRQ